jgi:transposase
MVGAACERVACPQKVACSMTRRSYSLEFKDEACRLVMVRKQGIAQTAKQLGIHANSLEYWLKKKGFSMSTPHELPSESKDPAALAARIRELEAKVKRLETERDILKKATVWFATQSQSDSDSSTGTAPNGRSR